MAINIDPTNDAYDMAEMRLDGEPLYPNEFEYSVSEDGGEPKTVTNSKDPIRYGASKNTVEWSASGLQPEEYSRLMEYKLKNMLFPITVFNFGSSGQYNPVATINNARITEVSFNYGDDGETIDISGSALSLDLPR